MTTGKTQSNFTLFNENGKFLVETLDGVDVQ